MSKCKCKCQSCHGRCKRALAKLLEGASLPKSYVVVPSRTPPWSRVISLPVVFRTPGPSPDLPCIARSVEPLQRAGHPQTSADLWRGLSFSLTEVVSGGSYVPLCPLQVVSGYHYLAHDVSLSSILLLLDLGKRYQQVRRHTLGLRGNNCQARLLETEVEENG